MKLAALCLALLLGACWLAERSTGAPALSPPTASAPAAAAPAAQPAAAGPQWMGTLPGRASAVPAWRSLADARVHGDERAPPLAPAPLPEPGATPAELADPAAYRQREQGRDAQLMAAYVAAVDAELPRLRADVERARLAGIAAHDIAKVEAKIARLERLRKNILDTGHPGQ